MHTQQAAEGCGTPNELRTPRPKPAAAWQCKGRGAHHASRSKKSTKTLENHPVGHALCKGHGARATSQQVNQSPKQGQTWSAITQSTTHTKKCTPQHNPCPSNGATYAKTRPTNRKKPCLIPRLLVTVQSDIQRDQQPDAPKKYINTCPPHLVAETQPHSLKTQAHTCKSMH